MRRDEVPQDEVAHYGAARKAVYAVDARGAYGTVASSGWTVEETATRDAIAEYERLAAEALVRARAGEASALEYHMHARRMDLPTLAQATGLWQWRVRRHLRPARFAKLPELLRRRYAAALGLEPDALARLP
jgi:hypothetical protein